MFETIEDLLYICTVKSIKHQEKMSNKELLEKIQQGLNNLENEWLGNSTGNEVSEEGAALGAYSEAIERFQGLIDNLKEIVTKDSASEDLDELVISLEGTIGTSPHSREVIKEYLQKAVEQCGDIEENPIGWTEEDTNMFGSIRSTLSMYMNNPSLPKEIRDIHKEELKWLDELYDRGLS